MKIYVIEKEINEEIVEIIKNIGYRVEERLLINKPFVIIVGKVRNVSKGLEIIDFALSLRY